MRQGSRDALLQGQDRRQALQSCPSLRGQDRHKGPRNTLAYKGRIGDGGSRYPLLHWGKLETELWRPFSTYSDEYEMRAPESLFHTSIRSQGSFTTGAGEKLGAKESLFIIRTGFVHRS
jgi:hypothetical protein